MLTVNAQALGQSDGSMSIVNGAISGGGTGSPDCIPECRVSINVPHCAGGKGAVVSDCLENFDNPGGSSTKQDLDGCDGWSFYFDRRAGSAGPNLPVVAVDDNQGNEFLWYLSNCQALDQGGGSGNQCAETNHGCDALSEFD
jgi:hypothetical protein